VASLLLFRNSLVFSFRTASFFLDQLFFGAGVLLLPLANCLHASYFHYDLFFGDGVLLQPIVNGLLELRLSFVAERSSCK